MKLEELQQSYIAEQRKVTVEKLNAGALILTVLSEGKGLVFKNGRTEKPKRLVVVGADKERNVYYGSVLINTKMNPNSAFLAEFLAAQFLLKQENYPEFLDYDSYVDCGVLIAVPLEKLLKGQYYGTLTEEDKAGIFDLLETTETLSTKEKKRFGIRRR